MVKMCSACRKFTDNYSKGQYVKTNYKRRCKRCIEQYKETVSEQEINDAWEKYVRLVKKPRDRPRAYLEAMRGVILDKYGANVGMAELYDIHQGLARSLPYLEGESEEDNYKVLLWFVRQYGKFLVTDEYVPLGIQDPPKIEQFEKMINWPNRNLSLRIGVQLQNSKRLHIFSARFNHFQCNL